MKREEATLSATAPLVLRIQWDGKEYLYNPSKVTVQSAIAIRDYTGMGMKTWEKAIDDADPRALQALLFAIKAQNGERAAIQTLDFSVSEFFDEVNRALREAIAERIASVRKDALGDEDEDPTETATS